MMVMSTPKKVAKERERLQREDRPQTPVQKRFARGEVSPNAPKTPNDRKFKNTPICGAPRSGNSSSGPGTCCQPAGWGTAHPGTGKCKLHGGNSPSHLAKAQRDQAVKEVATYGLPKDIDPQTALLEEVQRTAGHVDWLNNIIANLEDENALKQFTEAGVQPSVWIEMYQRERKHLMDVCTAAIKCGVAERQIRLAEEQGKILAMVLQAFIMDPELSLTPAQLTYAPKIMRKHLLAAPTETSSVLDV